MTQNHPEKPHDSNGKNLSKALRKYPYNFIISSYVRGSTIFPRGDDLTDYSGGSSYQSIHDSGDYWSSKVDDSDSNYISLLVFKYNVTDLPAGNGGSAYNNEKFSG